MKLNKIKAMKDIIDNQDAIKEVGNNVIDKCLCDMCRKKMIRNNLLQVPIYKVFSPDYHRQIDATLCRRCKHNIRSEMLKNPTDNK